jgi:hypothetical protein
MNFQTRTLKAIGYLIDWQDEKLFSKIEATIKESQQQELTVKPFTKKQMVERAKRSNTDFLAGRVKTQDQLEIDSEKW